MKTAAAAALSLFLAKVASASTTTTTIAEEGPTPAIPPPTDTHLVKLSEDEFELLREIRAINADPRVLKKAIGSGPTGFGIEQYYTPHRVISYDRPAITNPRFITGYEVDPYTVDGFYFPAATDQYIETAPNSAAALPFNALHGYPGPMGAPPASAAVAVPLLERPPPAGAPPPLFRSLKREPGAGPTGYGIEQYYQPHRVLRYGWKPNYDDYITLGGPHEFPPSVMYQPTYRVDGVPAGNQYPATLTTTPDFFYL